MAAQVHPTPQVGICSEEAMRPDDDRSLQHNALLHRNRLVDSDTFIYMIFVIEAVDHLVEHRRQIANKQPRRLAQTRKYFGYSCNQPIYRKLNAHTILLAG